MQLTVIGSGTAAPTWDRVCSGYYVAANGLEMLFDCGPGVVHNMARLAIDWRALTHLVITHFHNDHIGDIPMLFFAWKHGMLPARTQPLHVIGPKGIEKLLAKMGGVFGDHVSEPDFEVTITGIEETAELKLNDVARLRACRTNHTEHSLAYRIEADGRSFCYTGDTGPSRTVEVFAQGVDTLLVECSLPDDEPMPTHLTPSQVAQLARHALPRRLMVTHLYPQLSRKLVPDLVRAGGWPAEVVVARDGERVEI